MPPIASPALNQPEEPHQTSCVQLGLSGSAMLIVKTNEKLSYLGTCSSAPTWGGREGQIDIIHGILHQRPPEHIHICDGEDPLTGCPRNPPLVPILVHLSKQCDPLTLKDAAQQSVLVTPTSEKSSNCF